ncbi:MAG: LysR family transcriptional regulator [Clostridiaceae bacterium]|nr:LysR family transcriptional regulator [Clostridiaceae bacterium]
MTNRNLEIFVAVAECGKMSQAARNLFITQSSVSQAIAEIEKEYGVLLFERLSRSLYLTETGRDFLIYAKKVLTLQSEMEGFLRDTSKLQKVRIGATVTVGTCLISPIILRLTETLPGIRAEVTVANTNIVEDRLLKNQLDIGLVEGKIRHPDIIAEKVMKDDMALICSSKSPFFGRHEIDVKELDGQPLILREQGSGTRDQLERVMKAEHLFVNALWECCNSEAIINGVLYGHAMTVMSKRLVAQHISEGKLWACDITGADLSRTFDIVYHKDKMINTGLSAFINICRNFEITGGEARNGSL